MTLLRFALWASACIIACFSESLETSASPSALVESSSSSNQVDRACYEPGIWFYGSDIFTSPLIVQTGAAAWPACQYECTKVPSCLFWTVGVNNGHCYLKRSDAGRRKASYSAISGPRECPTTPTTTTTTTQVDRACYESGIDLYGSDIFTSPLIVQTGAAAGPACQYECTKVPSCLFWTVGVNTGLCYLKWSDAGRRKAFFYSAISGPRECPTTTKGLWIKSDSHKACNDPDNKGRFHGTGKTLDWCKNKCLSEGDCQSIFGALGHGDGSCWTFSGRCTEDYTPSPYNVWQLQASCSTDGIWHAPLSSRTVAASGHACKARCISEGQAYFNWFPDGGCHCSISGAKIEVHPTNPTEMSGSVQCLEAKEVEYYQMKKGSCCCPPEERIQSKEECYKAHAALGLKSDSLWQGTSAGMPGGCSTDQSHGSGWSDIHWNGNEPGRARGDLTPICKMVYPGSAKAGDSLLVVV